MGAPLTKAQAIANAKAKAAAQAADAEHTQRIVAEDAEQYDSRWSRDPGRANGPYS